MAHLRRDLVYALRLFAKRPGFTAVAVLTLALGIGANTAIFSLVHGILLGSVPFDEPEELVFLGERSEQIPNMSVSYPNFLDWRERNRSFEGVAAHNYSTFNLTGLDVPEVLLAARVSANLFDLLRVRPELGRAFTEEEDRVGAEKVVLTSYDFWQTRLGGASDVLGRTLSLDGAPYEIVGVMPPGFLYPISSFAPDLWMPIEQFAESWLEARGSHPGIYVTGRLREGVTLERAEEDMQSIARALAAEYPDTNTGNGVSFAPLTERVVSNIRPALLVLSGAVALVLLIACANVANLLVARGLGRRREIAVRSALGSGRWALVRQLLTESVVLALAGGVLGVAVAAGALAVLKSRIDPELFRGFGAVTLDGTVLGFTVVLSIATGLLFGLAPAFHLLRVDLTSSLKEGGRGSSGGQGGLRGALVVLEVAVALVVLIGALLLIQSFQRLSEADPGFEAERVLTVNVNLPEAGYPEAEQQWRFFEALLERVRSLPGVVAAATTQPLLGNWQNTVLPEGRPAPAPGNEISADTTWVSPGYFETLGVELLRGRTFTEADRAGARPVAIVDATFAEGFWPGEDPIGRSVKLGSDPASDNPWMTIVGVVEHVKNYGVAQPSRIEIYMPAAQTPRSFTTLVVKTERDPRALVNPVRDEVLALDRDQPIYRVRTLEELTAATTAPQRMAAGFLGAFSTVALLLAAVGIYGVMAYSIAQRQQELGIRTALGATRSRLLAMVLMQGSRLAAVGVAIGLAGALLAAPLLSSVLFGIEARDARTFVALPLALGAVSLLASVIPALRASRVSPVVVLRYE